MTTGNIKVQIQTSSDLNGVTYSVYSEVYLTAVDEYVPPVTTGTISGGQILIRGLNAGNYILELNAGHNLRYFIQATAGQERTFSISI